VIAVSPEFNAAVKATVRKWRPKLEVTWTDPFTDPAITASANDKNRINYPEQVADLVEIPTRRWAHLDGTFKPNGTFHPCPSAAESLFNQMGWWGAARCDASAEWGLPYPTLTIEFAARPVLALIVVGDSIYNEYPVDFYVKLYNGDDDVLYTDTVAGNANLRYVKSIASAGITDAVKMTLEVKKWSAPNRVVKILEFYTAVVETYYGDDIVSMNLLEESEISDGSLPIGNISCNELDFELQNIKLITSLGETILNPFYPGNTNSYLHNLIKRNRKVRAWLGLVLPDASVEYVPLGTFWTGDPKVSERSPVISFSCRDRMELLRKAEFTGSEVYQNESLYDLAVVVLEHAKANIPMVDLEYSIDAALQDMVIPYAYFPKQTYFETIRQIAEACAGTAYMDRDDVLRIGTEQNLETTTAGA
jgi:hypothetical protein